MMFTQGENLAFKQVFLKQFNEKLQAWVNRDPIYFLKDSKLFFIPAFNSLLFE